MNTPTPTEAAEVVLKKQSPLQRWLRRENTLILVALLALILLFSVWAPGGSFFSAQNVANIALDASSLLIIAGGVTLLIIAGGLDLSVGAVIVFSSVVAGKVMLAIAGPIAESVKAPLEVILLTAAAGLGTALVCGWLWGALNAFVILKLRVPSIIATLATLSIAMGLAQIISAGVSISGLPVQLQRYFGGARLAGVVPYPVLIAVLVIAILWVVLAKTRFGMRTYAIGGDRRAAERAGIRVDRHMLILYTLVGFLAGIVAFIDLARFGTASLTGHTQDALNAIAAVVIGGVSLFGGWGRMSGAIIGVFIPAVLANGFVVVRVDPFWQNVAVGVVLILAVYVDQLRRGADQKGK